MSRLQHSLVIPAYNEAGRIAETLADLAEYLQTETARQWSWQVIVVCDGCRDGTHAVVSRFADKLPLQVISYPVNRGKGYAVRQGIARSTGHIVTFMDADGAVPVHEWERLAAPVLMKTADVVIGSRRATDATVYPRQSAYRTILGRCFALYTRLVLNLRFLDTQCGFKLFHGPTARTLFAGLRCDGFAFDLELLAAARKRHLRVLETGVEWHERAGSTVRPLRDGSRMLLAAWRIRRRQNAAPSFLPAFAPETPLIST